MAVIQLNEPKYFDLSKNMMQVRAGSDTDLVITPGIYPGGALELGVGTTVNGGYFNFEWEDNFVKFTITSSPLPDPTNSLLPLKGGTQSWADYVANVLVPKFNSNALFSENYLAEVDPMDPERIIITAYEQFGELNLYPTITPNTGFVFIATGGAPAVVLADKMKIQLEIQMETANNSGTFETIGTLAKEVIDDEAIFYIEDIVNANLSYELPVLSSFSSKLVTQTSKSVQLIMRERYGTPEVNYASLTLDPYKVIKAGWPKEQFQLVDHSAISTLDAYYLENSLFLTRQPRTKLVFPESQDWLYFYFYGSTTKDLKLKVTQFFNDGSSTSSILLTRYAVDANSIVIFPTGLSTIGLSTTVGNKKLTHYDVVITENIGNLSETFRYVVNYDSPPDKNHYLFTNSDGGCDVFCATGIKEENAEVSFEEGKRLLDFPYDVPFGEWFTNKNYILKSFKQNTGLITEEQCKWLNDFLLADEKYLITDDDLIPIKLLSKTKPTKASQQNLFYFDFEYMIAYENNAIDINRSLNIANP